MAAAGPLGPLGAARLFTFAFERSVAFYRDRLGLALQSRDQGVAVFDTGACRLILEAADPDDPEERALVGRFAGLSFTVCDLSASYEALTGRGVAFLGPPEQQDWGGKLTHFTDPDGNVLSLVEYP